MEYKDQHSDGSRSGGQPPKQPPKPLTEAVWRDLRAVSWEKVVPFLRERGLIADEPVDPDLLEAREIVINDGTDRTPAQVTAIREGRAGKDKVALALAALKRGKELRPTLTREMVREAVVVLFSNADGVTYAAEPMIEEAVGRVYAALMEQMQ